MTLPILHQAPFQFICFSPSLTSSPSHSLNPSPSVSLLQQADKPIWRNNWAAAFTDDITEPSYNVGGPDAQLKATGGVRPSADKLFLKTEYQTLRRLPQTGAILFTIRTLIQPIPEIGVEAAKTLHKSLSGMTPELRAYKGVPGEYGDELLHFLEGMVQAEESSLVAAYASQSGWDLYV